MGPVLAARGRDDFFEICRHVGGRSEHGGSTSLLLLLAALLPAAAHAWPGTSPAAQSGQCPTDSTLPPAALWRLRCLLAVPGAWPYRPDEATQFLQQSHRAERSLGRSVMPRAVANATWPASPWYRNSSNGHFPDGVVTLRPHPSARRHRGIAGHRGLKPLMLMVCVVGTGLLCSLLWRRTSGCTATPPRPQNHLETATESSSSIRSVGDCNLLFFGSWPAFLVHLVGSMTGSSTCSLPQLAVPFSSASESAERSSGTEVLAHGSPKLEGLGPTGTEGIPVEPICRELVLPKHKAHLLVRLKSLEKAIKEGGEFHILSAFGRPLLRVEVQCIEDSQALDMFMVGEIGTLHMNGWVLNVMGGAKGSTKASCEIRGADGKQYGQLLCSASAFYVYCPGETQPVLVLSRDAAGLHLAVRAGKDGPLVALTNRTYTSSGTEQLELRTCPGADNALVLACILSTLLFF